MRWEKSMRILTSLLILITLNPALAAAATQGRSRDTVRFAVANPHGRWGTKFEKRSPRYTTRLPEVLTIP